MPKSVNVNIANMHILPTASGCAQLNANKGSNAAFRLLATIFWYEIILFFCVYLLKNLSQLCLVFMQLLKQAI